MFKAAAPISVQDSCNQSVWVLFGILFITLIANKLALPISGNEENYLAFAKQFWNPNWIKDSFSLTDFPGTRIVFQVLVGSALNVLPWDMALLLFRISGFLLLAGGVAHLLRTLRFSYLEAFVAFQLYIMSKQSMFGREHIFSDFEPKTLAYAAVFISLSYFLSGNRKRTAAFLILATYFHFLVGGWLAVVFSIQMILEKRYRNWAKFISVFIIGIMPLLIYLYVGYFSNTDPTVTLNVDWIYVYFRNPHHLGIFSSPEYFWNNSALGVGLSAAVLVLSLFLHSWFEGLAKRINRLVQIILGINLFFVLVAFCDYAFLDSSGGLFLKYYPFRSNALATFFALLLFMLFLRTRMKLNVYKRFMLIASVITFVLGIVQFKNGLEWRKAAAFTDTYLDACNFIQNETPISSSFALIDLESSESHTNAFMTLTERENFAVFKFVPTEKSRVVEWYARQKDIHQLSENIDYCESIKRKYGVDYVLTAKNYDTDKLELVFDNDKFHVYRIR